MATCTRLHRVGMPEARDFAGFVTSGRRARRAGAARRRARTAPARPGCGDRASDECARGGSRSCEGWRRSSCAISALVCPRARSSSTSVSLGVRPPTEGCVDVVRLSRRERDPDRRLQVETAARDGADAREEIGLRGRLQHVPVGARREHVLNRRQIVAVGQGDDRDVGEAVRGAARSPRREVASATRGRSRRRRARCRAPRARATSAAWRRPRNRAPGRRARADLRETAFGRRRAPGE